MQSFLTCRVDIAHPFFHNIIIAQCSGRSRILPKGGGCSCKCGPFGKSKIEKQKKKVFTSFPSILCVGSLVLKSEKAKQTVFTSFPSILCGGQVVCKSEKVKKNQLFDGPCCEVFAVQNLAIFTSYDLITSYIISSNMVVLNIF